MIAFNDQESSQVFTEFKKWSCDDTVSSEPHNINSLSSSEKYQR